MDPDHSKDSDRSESQQPARRLFTHAHSRRNLFRVILVGLVFAICAVPFFVFDVPRRLAELRDRALHNPDSIDYLSDGNLEGAHRQLLHDLGWPPGAFSHIPKAGYAPTPGYNGTVASKQPYLRFDVRIHELGYRIPAEADQRHFSPGGILTLGCSFTYGDEVDSPWTQHASQRLFEENGERMGYNFGCTCYSYAEMIRRFELLESNGILKILEPQHVVIGGMYQLAERSLWRHVVTLGMGRFYKPYIDFDANSGRHSVQDYGDRFDPRIIHQFYLDYFGRPETYPPAPQAREILFPFTERRRELMKQVRIPVVEAGRSMHKDRKRVDGIKQQAISADLYELVFGRLLDVCRRNDIEATIIWLPSYYRTTEEADDELPKAREAIDRLQQSEYAVTLLNGWQSMHEHPNWNGVPEDYQPPRGRSYRSRTGGIYSTITDNFHPGEIAHRLFGAQVAEHLAASGVQLRERVEQFESQPAPKDDLFFVTTEPTVRKVMPADEIGPESER